MFCLIPFPYTNLDIGLSLFPQVFSLDLCLAVQEIASVFLLTLLFCINFSIIFRNLKIVLLLLFKLLGVSRTRCTLPLVVNRHLLRLCYRGFSFLCFVCFFQISVDYSFYLDSVFHGSDLMYSLLLICGH